jgi:exodeoxyribonuclease III
MLRLLTYNIKQGGHGRIALIASVINAANPDVVLLQEATDPSNVERIAAATGMAAWRALRRQSLAFLSRRQVASSGWTRPRFSRHAFIEVTTEDASVRVFGVHLSAMHAAWTERRRLMEIRALLRSIGRHQHGFHVLAGDFNTLAPDEPLDVERLPFRLRPLVWLSGGRIRWRTIQTVLDAGYVDCYRLKHPDQAGPTLPTAQPHIRLDYVFVPAQYEDSVAGCDVFTHPDAVAASDHFPVVADLHTKR